MAGSKGDKLLDGQLMGDYWRRQYKVIGTLADLSLSSSFAVGPEA